MGFRWLTNENIKEFTGQGSTPTQDYTKGATPSSDYKMPWDQGQWDLATSLLQDRAQGKGLIAPMQTARTVEQGKKGIASQMASAGYSPATFRAGTQAMSGLTQQAAGQGAIAAQMEQTGAQQALVNALLGYGGVGAGLQKAQMQAQMQGQGYQYGAEQGALNRQSQEEQQQNALNQQLFLAILRAQMGQQAGQSGAQALLGS